MRCCSRFVRLTSSLWMTAYLLLSFAVSDVRLTSAIARDDPVGRVRAAQLEAVATYTSIGLYWSASAAPGGQATVQYRAVGNREWRQAQPLRHDERRHDVRGKHIPHWRGSIVGLTADTTYEVAVGTRSAADVTTVRTWSERPAIGRQIELALRSEAMLAVREGGSSDAYLLIRPRMGESATIDAGGRQAHNIYVDAPFVIIRGLRLGNAREDAIKLGPRAHDVIIEDNNISGWGRVDVDGLAVDRDAAVGTVTEDSQGIRRITIQRNRIHDPRAGANSWVQQRPLHNTSHPLGPHGVFLWETGGNHVIRLNDFSSPSGRYYNDVIGGGQNFGTQGAPGPDSDIYGNSISDCWDDGIESEGGNINVRIWGNRIDRCYIAIGASPTHVGPLYVFRNLVLGMRYSPRHAVASGVFIKVQSKMVEERFWGGGRLYVFHNTVRGMFGRHGAYAGITPFGTTLRNVISRNNIFDVSRAAIDDPTGDSSNDLDYDLLGALTLRSPATVTQPHGLRRRPVFSFRTSPPGTLSEGSPGRDDGEVLANFNDGFLGSRPDRGAQEAGAPAMLFGIPR